MAPLGVSDVVGSDSANHVYKTAIDSLVDKVCNGTIKSKDDFMVALNMYKMFDGATLHFITIGVSTRLVELERERNAAA